ncbi:MAG: hypothetical protein M1438_06445 [Deltaproteobacteria bacterium]|nr:hypothetical protein [Deltaproteobacteria bacterium]
MKRILAGLTVSLMVFWVPAWLAAQPRAGGPSGTVEIHATRVSFGVGFTKGEGYLHYKGDDFRFKVRGLSAVGMGLTTLNATGNVYNLMSIKDFPGNYYSFEPGGTFLEGSEALVMKNSKGVVIALKAQQTGMELKLGNEGLRITPAWD